MARHSNDKHSLYLRNIIFGVEDSLVSTVGLLSGIAIVGTSKSAIFLTGMVLIVVEAFSMGVGSIISERSVEQYQTQRSVPLLRVVEAGAVMFVSYVLSGFIPLLPYLLTEPAWALPYSVVASLAALFILGAIGGKISKIGLVRQGIEMAVLGGVAILLGVVVGMLINQHIS